MRSLFNCVTFIILSLLTQASLAINDFVLVASQVVSPGSTSIQFTSIGSYHRYYLVIDNMLPTASTQSLLLRFSINNGVSYISNNNYVFIISGASTTNQTNLYGSMGTNAARINGGTVDHGEPLSGIINLAGMNNAGVKPFFQANLAYYSSARPVMSTGGGSFKVADTYNAFALFMSNGGTFRSGTFTLYGLN
jgi:hypothetical protein